MTAAPKRRWSFSLRTLFVVVTLIAFAAHSEAKDKVKQMSYAQTTIGLVLAMAFAFPCSAEATGSETNTEMQKSEFGDKFVLIFVDEEMRIPSFILEKVEIREIEGRKFLTGVGADTKRKEDTRFGRTIRVSWKAVKSYMVFSKEEYEQYREGK
jgi:hypothetical protein